MNEDILQSQIYRWYHNTYCTKLNNPKHCIFSVPNGGNRSKAEAMKMKSTGLVAGVSDLIIVRPEAIYFVEVKFERGKQSKEQIDFENTVKAMGYNYFLVRSLDDFKELWQNKN